MTEAEIFHVAEVLLYSLAWACAVVVGGGGAVWGFACAVEWIGENLGG